MNENWCLQHSLVAGQAVSHLYKRDPDTYIRIAIQTYETEVFFLRVSFFNKIFFLKTNEESKKTIFQNFFLVFETISAHFKKSFVKNNCPRTFLLLLLSTEIVDFCFFSFYGHGLKTLQNYFSGCSTAEEHTPRDREVVGLNPA